MNPGKERIREVEGIRLGRGVGYPVHHMSSQTRCSRRKKTASSGMGECGWIGKRDVRELGWMKRLEMEHLIS